MESVTWKILWFTEIVCIKLFGESFINKIALTADF